MILLLPPRKTISRPGWRLPQMPRWKTPRAWLNGRPPDCNCNCPEESSSSSSNPSGSTSSSSVLSATCCGCSEGQPSWNWEIAVAGVANNACTDGTCANWNGTHILEPFKFNCDALDTPLSPFNGTTLWWKSAPFPYTCESGGFTEGYWTIYCVGDQFKLQAAVQDETGVFAIAQYDFVPADCRNDIAFTFQTAVNRCAGWPATINALAL